MKAQHPSDPPAGSSPEERRGQQFVERMFSGFGHTTEIRPVHKQAPSQPPFEALRVSKAKPGTTYRLRTQTLAVRVQADSPAIDVMTDLSHVAAVATRSYATVDEALRAMIAYRVRALFVVDDPSAILGIVTSADLMGERPIQIAQQRGVRHDDVLVREVMTPAHLLETMELGDVLRARVGDILISLKRSGRQHALVVEPATEDASNPTETVRGIFSLTQIARQLGLPPQSEPDVARTFAEIEAVIGA